jgi:hypothetical protein
MNLKSFKAVKGAILISVVLALCISTFALVFGKKEDFQEAVRSSGCGLIPYSLKRESCRENYTKQREWCTGDRERGCNDLKKEDPKDRQEAKERRDNAEQCGDYRKAVRQLFQDASDRLRDEDDPNDPDIKRLAQDIANKIDEGKAGHEAAMHDTENRRQKCDDVYHGD